jgi:hypothetical protein
VTSHTLGLTWILLAVLLGAGLIWELSAWRSVSARAARAAAERNRLTEEIRQKEEEIVREMRMHAGLLQDLQWSAAGADPSVFLNRLAELAQGSRMRITGIGPLEKQSTAQFTKLWHTVQVTGPYRDIRELAARVEREKGVLEDLVVEVRDPGPAGGGDLSARFRMTALELSPEGKKILDRALAAAGKADASRAPSLALPLPSRTDGEPELRDPFVFGPGVVASSRAPVSQPVASAPAAPRGPATGGDRPAAPPPAPSRPETPMELKGIVGFPGGHLAILNNQIVKTGDSVAGHRVERISEREVILKSPEGGTRIVPLPAIGAGGDIAAPARADKAAPGGGSEPPVAGSGPAPPRR